MPLTPDIELRIVSPSPSSRPPSPLPEMPEGATEPTSRTPTTQMEADSRGGSLQRGCEYIHRNFIVRWSNWNCLKPKFTHYPAIHTNYSLSNCTTLQYNHNYMTRYLGRNEMLNTKDIEFNSVAISVLWHELPRSRPD